MDEIAEFIILDGIWTKNEQMTNRLLEKLSKSTIVAKIGDRWLVAESGDCTILSIQYVANFGEYSRHFLVASVDKALSPHFAASPDCHLGWSAPSASSLYASGCRQTICLQLTRAQCAVGLHAKTFQLHHKNLLETLKAL